MTKYHLIVGAMLAAAACGGDGATSSGVDPDKNVATLTASEIAELCEWVVAEGGGPGFETECDDGVTVINNTVQECIDEYPEFADDCQATIADFEDCAVANGADPCDFAPDACDALFACIP